MDGLSEQGIEKLQEWFHTLNSWQWPDDYPVPKPEGFDELPRHEHLDYKGVTQLAFISPEMDWILKTGEMYGHKITGRIGRA